MTSRATRIPVIAVSGTGAFLSLGAWLLTTPIVTGRPWVLERVGGDDYVRVSLGAIAFYTQVNPEAGKGWSILRVDHFTGWPLTLSFGLQWFRIKPPTSSQTYYLIYIPLWLVFLLFLIPGAFAIRRSFKKKAVDHPLCENCGYILRGNISGICSECGTPITEKTSGDEPQATQGKRV